MTGHPDQRPIVVTGAASGMGRATAIRAATLGYPVVLLDVDAEGLGGAEEELQERGAPVLVRVTDVSSRSDLECAFAHSQEAFGPCWGLAAAAGIITGSPYLETPAEQTEALIAVNLIGVLLSNQLAAAQMISSGRGGRIVNWASDAAFGASPGFAVYGATKAAVVSLTSSASLELASHGITVNALVPGIVDTPMADHYSPEQKERIGALIPVGRWGTAEELARVACFLLSEESSYLSGAPFFADGGATAALGRHLISQLVDE